MPEEVEIPEQVIFAFTFNMVNKSGTFTGNVPPMMALSILQGMVISHVANQNGGVPNETGAPSPEPKD